MTGSRSLGEQQFFCELVARYIARALPPRYVLIDFDEDDLRMISDDLSRMCGGAVSILAIKSFKDAAPLAEAIRNRGKESPLVLAVERSVLGFVASVTSVLRVLENSLPGPAASPPVGSGEQSSANLADLLIWMCTKEGEVQTCEALKAHARAGNVDSSMDVLWRMLSRPLLLEYPALLPKFHPIRIARFLEHLNAGKSLNEASFDLGMIPSSGSLSNVKAISKWYQNQLKVFSKLNNVRFTAKRRVYQRFLETLVRKILRTKHADLYRRYMRPAEKGRRVPSYGAVLRQYDTAGVIGRKLGLDDSFTFQILPRDIRNNSIVFVDADDLSIDIMEKLSSDQDGLRIEFDSRENRAVANIESLEGYLVGI